MLYKMRLIYCTGLIFLNTNFPTLVIVAIYIRIFICILFS